MSSHLKEMTKIIKPEFLHYQESNPEILATLKMANNEWDALELYRKVHIREFHEIISSLNFNPKYILEWGSGLSSYILSDFCLKWDSKLFLTIDHSKEYQSGILENLEKPTCIEVCTMDLIGAIWPWDQNIYNYATYPFSKKAKFDLIYIDGRRRNECMLVASKVLSEKGILIVHDIWRRRYELGRNLFKEVNRLDEYAILSNP